MIKLIITLKETAVEQRQLKYLNQKVHYRCCMTLVPEGWGKKTWMGKKRRKKERNIDEKKENTDGKNVDRKKHR